MSLLLEALKKADQNKSASESSFVLSTSSAVTADEAVIASDYKAENILEFSLESEAASGKPDRKESAAPAIEKTRPENEAIPDHDGGRFRKETSKTLIQERAGVQTQESAPAAKPENKLNSLNQRRYMGLAVIGGLLVVLAGGTYYVWQEIVRLSGNGGLSGVAPLSRPPDRFPSASSVLPASREAGVAAEVPAISPAIAPAVTPVEVSSEKPAASDTLRPLVSPHTLSVPYDRPLAPAAEREIPRSGKNRNPANETAVRFRHNQDKGEVAPLLAAAYEAYVAGELEAARQLYLKQLQIDPTSKDVLLGLAAIATRTQLPVQAKQYYQKILEIDPHDALAVSGLAGLGWMNDSSQTESRIKTLLAQQPDAASLHFMLGNHYTGQSRWTEAQQSYFRAFSIEPVNADYAFNLAVSLDHLGQVRLAREYYGKALKLSGSVPASFDKEQASKRLDELLQ